MKVPHIDRELGMLCYMSESEPVSGRLREKLSDFIVDEVLEGRRASRAFLGMGKFEGSGSHYYVLLKHERIEDRELIKRVSRALGGRVGFAGIKDARSISFQFISSDRFAGRELRLPGATVRWVGRGEWISSGLNDGNYFCIVVRGAEELKLIRRFPNFFSYQRFGTRRPYNHEVGRALVMRDLEGARDLLSRQGYDVGEARSLKQLSDIIGKELLKFYVHSYQSYLFNLLLSRRIERGLSPEDGDFVLKPSGEIAMHPESGELLLPIPGAFTRTKGGWIEEELNALLRDESLDKEDFIFRELPEISSLGDFRKAVCEISSHKLLRGKGFVVLSFFLESGSYATSYLREIMKPRDPVSQGFI